VAASSGGPAAGPVPAGPSVSPGRFGVRDRALARAAAAAVGQCLAVQPGERVLIVTNPAGDSSRIAQALYDAVQDRGGSPLLLHQPVRTQLDFADEAVYQALATRPAAFISLSRLKLGQDARGVASPYTRDGRSYNSLFHFLLYGEKALRAFWSPEVDRGIFSRAVPIDYARLAAECARVKPLLDQAVRARLTAPGGTDLTLGLRGRGSFADDGDFRRPGAGGNLPAGEVFISPELGTAEGRVAFDGSLALPDGILRPRRPVVAEVRGGFVTEVHGGPEAVTLAKALERTAQRCRDLESEGALPAGGGEQYARNTYNLGELGIGLNRAARAVGSMINDEKAYGTCHLAIGYNFDEDAPALTHLDGLVHRPTLELEFEGGRPPMRLLQEGRLLV